MITPVIIAGGTGSRLWPMSRELYPKQFLNIYGENSLLQETLIRLKGLSINESMVICNEKHRFLVAEQLRQIGNDNNSIILEPVGRNTAPAITLAAINALKSGNDPLLLVLAADHVIENIDEFHSVVEKSISLAEAGKMVTFGIVPSSPETGYGYIKRGEEITDGGYQVSCFVEKPNRENAELYFKSNEYYWNSGMFLFKASRYIEELEKFRPDILSSCEKSMAGVICDAEQSFIRIDETSFSSCPDDSIDYAVMEKTGDAVVIPLNAGWNDVGSWSALWDIANKDDRGNVLIGDVFIKDTNNCYINADEKFVATVGINDLVIVNTKDALMIIDKNKVQDVKKIVEFLKVNNRTEHSSHRESFRPWGKSDKVISENRYTINKLTVRPGGRFSLQLHHHRAEHWIILSGTAKVTIDDEISLLTENQSTFIPVGSIHMLENPGKIPLVILEVQSGSYLEDDDIIRIKDSYGRC
ncbi:mannose-1-phosphate guanyltransferase [Tatumella morbirosei]|uniref:mannose-1-phosphate guanylyltransferase n=1 Tax=Tatumella morbirosei TaxID=642227 RepID=A0A095TEL0_9GAMM|nr:mannose-1-phosphate guanylyltransferase/mannose-6-phosphate isomerase [Tatumella morbirosei]KGD74979.1 mannose-1-phosphate guanyltransferase [Tatumella morbirosei]